MNIYAVIDTNVIISSMLSVNPNSPTKEVINNVWKDIITPMINAEIIEEYCDVLSRSKFHFKETDIKEMLNLFRLKGEEYTPNCIRDEFTDLDDVIFYETYLMKEDSYLVTGNLKHFPSEPRILPPADIVKIIMLSKNDTSILSEPRARYTSDTKDALLQRAWQAIERMRASALANGIADMPMEEINEEIRAVRQSKHSKI
jgi:putative PIN family toxin of toxin-antitoxin system